jgi:hypothetical protein
MASITIKMRPEELDDTWLKTIQSMFKSGKLTITFETDDATSLDKLGEALALRTREGASFEVPGEALDQLLDMAESDDTFDVMTALRQYKKG